VNTTIQAPLLADRRSEEHKWTAPPLHQAKDSNWIQTLPGKGWFTLLRLYSPEESFFDKTWRPSEIEPMR
jgi:hypothetical protein